MATTTSLYRSVSSDTQCSSAGPAERQLLNTTARVLAIFEVRPTGPTLVGLTREHQARLSTRRFSGGQIGHTADVPHTTGSSPTPVAVRPPRGQLVAGEG